MSVIRVVDFIFFGTELLRQTSFDANPKKV